MKSISIEQVIELHKNMITVTSGMNGIRDRNLLESALINAFTTFNGVDLYNSIEEKCANICFSIIKNHPFIDGNKRIGIFIMLILLEYNNISIKYNQNELVDLGLRIADGSYNQEFIYKWIKNHTQTK